MICAPVLFLFFFIIVVGSGGGRFLVVGFVFCGVSRKMWSRVASKCCVAAGNGSSWNMSLGDLY